MSHTFNDVTELENAIVEVVERTPRFITDEEFVAIVKRTLKKYDHHLEKFKS